MTEVTEQPRTLRKPQFVSVDKIRPGANGFNVYLKVQQVNFEKATKVDGTTLEIADALCGDETGCVKVRAIGENAAKFQVGKIVAIRNGRSVVFKERLRLEIDRWGKITSESGVDVKDVNTKNNLSDVEYEMKVVKVSSRGGHREDRDDEDDDHHHRQHDNRRGNRDNRRRD